MSPEVAQKATSGLFLAMIIYQGICFLIKSFIGLQ
jgi:hypothetical protein